MFKIKAVLNCDVIKMSLADCLKLNSSFTLISFLTDLTPLVSHASFVKSNFSSTFLTLPVKKILPSKTFELIDKKYLLSIKSKVLDGRIFLKGKVDNPEEKLKLTKIAWETQGVRSVRNDIKIKEEFNFKQSAKDLLITSQLRTAFVLNKNIRSTNYQIDTYKKKIYVYGIALTIEEKDLVISEAKEILDVEDVIASIILVEDLRIQRE